MANSTKGDLAVNERMLNKYHEDCVQPHLDQKTMGATGAHGIRYNNEILQVYDENTHSWKPVSLSIVKYTAIIDFTKSDPAQMITYADDAAAMSKGYANWKTKPIFKDLKQAIVVNGVVQNFLNDDNITLLDDGATAADITTLGNDVMTIYPYRIGYRIEWQDSDHLVVSVTNSPNDPEYNYDAFSLDSYNDCDWISVGVFKGHVNNGRLYSSSGKAVTVSQTEDTFRTQARARGDGYQLASYGALKLWQCLYIICHGTLNSQSAVGMGYVKSSHSAGVVTGGTNGYGFNNELCPAADAADQEHQVKCLGREDAWGNYWEFVDGLGSDASFNVMTCQCAKDFRTDCAGYTNNGNGGVTANIGNYMKKPQGGSNAGFVAKDVSGASDSTYFCDDATLRASCLAWFGGIWSHAANAGAFRLYVYDAFSCSYASVGARLMFMHKEGT